MLLLMLDAVFTVVEHLIMSEEDLREAVKNGEEGEVLRLLDEAQVNVMCVDRVCWLLSVA